jgi:D-lyxose ketol-isomerase
MQTNMCPRPLKEFLSFRITLTVGEIHLGVLQVITIEQLNEARRRAKEYLDRASIALTDSEVQNIEVADFGLSQLETTGLELVVYVNTSRCCAKELVLFPGQTCPEHRHPSVDGLAGKEETFRCRWGEVYLYVPGPAVSEPRAKVPSGRENTYTVWNEIILKPGDQYTLAPDTLHWFQGGPEGAVVSEFSTSSRDELDIFTDAEINRMTKLAG